MAKRKYYINVFILSTNKCHLLIVNIFMAYQILNKRRYVFKIKGINKKNKKDDKII